jgi:hypothetical protein
MTAGNIDVPAAAAAMPRKPRLPVDTIAVLHVSKEAETIARQYDVTMANADRAAFACQTMQISTAAPA